MTVRVLLVDDEALVRGGLRYIIDGEPDLEVVGEVADGADVPDAVARTSPGVVLMDVRMPGLDGISATRALLRQADRAGASGFLLRRAHPDEVLEAIRVVARGKTLLFPTALRRLKTHVGSILTKLGVRDRTQAVIHAYESGFVRPGAI